MRTPSSSVKWLAIAAILGTGLIHFIEAPDSFGEARYKGMLFLANGAGALLAAIGVYRNQQTTGRLLGLLITAGSILAYTASRTVGLPGLAPEPGAWLEPMGVASLTCEVTFVILFFIARQTRS